MRVHNRLHPGTKRLGHVLVQSEQNFERVLSHRDILHVGQVCADIKVREKLVQQLLVGSEHGSN